MDLTAYDCLKHFESWISGNNTSPGQNEKKWVALSIVILLGCCAMPKPVQAAPQRAPTAYELIDAVNAFEYPGIGSYAIVPILMIAAQTHAEYLASQTGQYSGHVGEGGTDADARAAALGYPQVPGLDINENWASLPASEDLDTLLFTVWGDDQHTHTMLHQMGQHVGAGVAVSGGQCDLLCWMWLPLG